MKTPRHIKSRQYAAAALGLAQALLKGHIHAVATGRKLAYYATREDDPNGPLYCIACDLSTCSPWVGSNRTMEAQFTAGACLAFLSDADKEKYGVDPDGRNWTKLQVNALG